MSRNRANKAELIKRREEVQELILHGHNHQFIVDRLSEQYKTSKRAIQEDIRLIGKQWEEKEPEIRQQKRNMYADRLQLMFSHAFGAGNMKQALEIQKEIHKLDGVYNEAEGNEDNMPKIVNFVKKKPLAVVNSDDDN